MSCKEQFSGAPMPAKARKKFLIEKIIVSSTAIIINDNPLDLSGVEAAERFNDIEGLSIAECGKLPARYGIGTIEGWVRTVQEGDAVYFNGYDVTEQFLSAAPETTQDVLVIKQKNGSKTTLYCQENSEAVGGSSMDGLDLDFGGFNIKTLSGGVVQTRSRRIQVESSRSIEKSDVRDIDTSDLRTYHLRGSESSEYDYIPDGITLTSSGSSWGYGSNGTANRLKDFPDLSMVLVSPF